MKEFIFNWNIENISYSWHKRGEEMVSPSFLADTLQNTVWTLRLYPRGCLSAYWISLYVYLEDDGTRDFSFDCELSCVSGNNLTLTSREFKMISASEARHYRIGDPNFLHRRDVLVRKKDLYSPQDTLRLRCRLWMQEGYFDEFSQIFGCTRLHIERALSHECMNPRTDKKKTVLVHSKTTKTLLISVDVSQQKDGLRIRLHPSGNKEIKFSSFKFFAVGKSRAPCQFISSWLVRPHKKVRKIRFSNTENKASILNKLKLTCEFFYSTGTERKSIEKVSLCSFKFPEFTTNCILSCIASGKLADCRSIYTDLWDLHVNRILCDVELKTKTTSFWVHKTVLCARSPVFSSMFTSDMKEKMTNCVEIVDLKDDTLAKLLKFFYTDGFEESQWDTVVELYYSADKYELERLKKSCASYFMDKIDALNACELLVLADRHNDSDLKWKVTDYIVRHRKRIVRSSMWKKLLNQQPLLAAKATVCGLKEIREENPVGSCNLSAYPSVMDDFKSVYHSQTDSDIVIQTSTATFHAHKIILCAGSSLLREMFVSGKSTDSLKVTDLEDDIVVRLLLFLYTDSLGDMNWETARKLYQAAVAYQVERLKIKSSCFLLENLKLSDASDLLQVTHDHQDVRLKSVVEDFISLRGKEKVLEVLDETKRSDTRPSKRSRLLINSLIKPS